jgi:hypothetical protein
VLNGADPCDDPAAFFGGCFGPPGGNSFGLTLLIRWSGRAFLLRLHFPAKTRCSHDPAAQSKADGTGELETGIVLPDVDGLETCTLAQNFRTICLPQAATVRRRLPRGRTRGPAVSHAWWLINWQELTCSFSWLNEPVSTQRCMLWPDRFVRECYTIDLSSSEKCWLY